jgi:hypothetical protein
MKKHGKQNWQEKQAYLFSLIKAKLPENIALSGEIEDVLDIKPDAAFRRIKRETQLRLDELCILCGRYNISMDKILNYNFNQDLSFKYLAINPADNDTYIQYIQQSIERYTALLQSVGKCDFFFAAADIPFYYFPNYPELMYFKLYEKYSIHNSQDVSYHDFCKQLDKDLIMPHYKDIVKMYMQIPSVNEIWSSHTIFKILQSLKYCAKSKCFNDKTTVLLILKQLSELIYAVEKDADKGIRINQQTNFNLYISPIDVITNIILLQNGDRFSCDIRLFTANSLFVNNEIFCTCIYKEIINLISKSLLVSARLKQERCDFFKDMHNQIDDMKTEILKLPEV